jgi:hypothetical protein
MNVYSEEEYTGKKGAPANSHVLSRVWVRPISVGTTGTGTMIRSG